MRFLSVNLPNWVAAGLLTAAALSSATAADPDSSIATHLAQATAPVVPNVPQENLQEYRALPPQEAAAEVEEGPTRYLEMEFLTSRRINTYGWLAAGIGGNSWGNPWNGTITFVDRSWQFQMNQLNLVNERTLDTEDGGWDWGGRVDLMYGTDTTFTTAAGLDAYNYNVYNSYFVPKWASSKYYGLALPQLYVELGRGDVSAKFGHFYTPIGYEVVPAVGNFFYTINDTFQYGEPFTHTGFLAQWKANDQLTWFGGLVNGWDNWSSGTSLAVNSSNPTFNSNAGFLGGATLKNSDETQALTIFTYSGNVMNGIYAGPLSGSAINANRSYISTVYTNELSDKWTYVFQNDNGWQFGLQDGMYTPTGSQGNNGLAQWYGLINYLFYTVNDKVTAGMRFEYFRDNNGFRVFNPLRNLNYNPLNGNAGGVSGPYQGNFWEITWGLNYRANKNWVFRPELRYDWYSPDHKGGPLPYGGNIGQIGGTGNQYGQLFGGGDFIFQF